MTDCLSADAAEAAFYDAFARGDHRAMMGIWAPDEDIVCVHPMGPRLIGRKLIGSSWRQILSQEAAHRFDIRVKTKWSTDVLAVHVLDEVISIVGNDMNFRPVIATNIYRRIDGRWYLAAHHTSVDAREKPAQTASADHATRH